MTRLHEIRVTQVDDGYQVAGHVRGILVKVITSTPDLGHARLVAASACSLYGADIVTVAA